MIHAQACILLCHMNVRFSSIVDMAVVDIEVIKARTTVPSETTETDQGFRTQLIDRDVCCVFTGLEARVGEGLHVIPFRRGSEVCSSLILMAISLSFCLF